MPCPSHPPWLDHSNYTWRRVQVMIWQLPNDNLTVTIWRELILEEVLDTVII
jgi:hypothetical protein